jgi:hypothetical protein
MHQTLHQRKSLRNAVRRNTDLSRFEPQVMQARGTVTSLLQAGARVVAVHPQKVVLQRQESIATIDDRGRVTWKQARGARALPR